MCTIRGACLPLLAGFMSISHFQAAYMTKCCRHFMAKSPLPVPAPNWSNQNGNATLIKYAKENKGLGDCTMNANYLASIASLLHAKLLG